MSRLGLAALVAAGLPLIMAAAPAFAGMASKGLKVDPMLEQAIRDSANDMPETEVPQPPPGDLPVFFDDEVTDDYYEIAPAQQGTMQSDEGVDDLLELDAGPEPEPEPEPEVVLAPTKSTRVGLPEIEEKHIFKWPEAPGQLKWGGVTFMPSLLLRTGWDDNIYASETREQSDFVTHIMPRLRIEIPDIRHQVALEAQAEGRYYLSNGDSEDVTDASVKLGGELVAEKGLSVPFNAMVGIEHEKREDDLLQQLPETPLERQDLAFDGGLKFKPGMFGLALLGHYKQQKFDDGTGRFSGLPVVRSDANRDILDFEFNTSFDFDPQNTLMLWGTIGKRDYQHATYVAGSGYTGPERDSSTYSGMMSWLFNFSDLNGHASFGLQDYNYDDRSIDEVRAFVGDIELDHRINDRTSINLQLSRLIEEDDEIIYPYFRTRAAAYADYQAWDDVMIAAGVDFNYNDFETITREDTTFDYRLIADYFYNDFLSFGAELVHTTRDSSVTGLDFQRNMFLLRARGRL